MLIDVVARYKEAVKIPCGTVTYMDPAHAPDFFEQALADEALPERVVVEKNVAKRVAKSHKIRTDTGIDITFPAEYGENPDFIEFVSGPNGLINIELKNIGHIENR